MPSGTENVGGAPSIAHGSKLDSPEARKLSRLMKQLSNTDPVKRAKVIKQLFYALEEKNIPKDLKPELFILFPKNKFFGKRI